MTSTMEYTRERALAVAGAGGKLILTFTNNVRYDFALTWVAHVRRLQLTNWLVGATDKRALDRFTADGIPTFSMRTNLPETEWDWGSPSFRALGQHKIELIYKTISWNLELVITDVDALVLREPFEFMDRYPSASFLTTSDHLANTTGSNQGGLEDASASSSSFNIGYMFFRKAALPLVRAWRDSMRADPRRRWDQGEFNALARATFPYDSHALTDRGLFWSHNKRVVGGVLPLALFCGGHNYYVSRLPQRLGEQPYSIHTTFQYGGAPGKRHRLREAGVWLDPPEYYNVSLLTFTPAVPDELLHPAGGMRARGHIELMRFQLRAIRTALALAFSLGRMLVLPPIWCGLDKYWAALSEKGVIPGAHAWVLPIRYCPLDHLVNPAEFKPSSAAYVREYSFLENPRVPHELRASVVHTAVQIHGGNAEWLRLKSLSKARVLDVSNLQAVASDMWERRAVLPLDKWKAFRHKFARVQGGWCCASRGQVAAGEPRSAGFRLLG